MKKTEKFLCLFLSLLLLAAFPSTAYAAGEGKGVETEEPEEQEEDALLAPYFIIQNEDVSLDVFPLKSTEVTTNINGIIAETRVIQTYANEGDTPINARYVFPTAPSVTVHGMTMQIGDNLVTAKIKEKEEAKEEYEEAKSEGKSASLLEQRRPNVFTMDVANIMPGDTARIELHYTELITPVDGIYGFVFPTVVGPRYSPDTSKSMQPEDTSSQADSSENAPTLLSEQSSEQKSVSENDAGNRGETSNDANVETDDKIHDEADDETSKETGTEASGTASDETRGETGDKASGEADGKIRGEANAETSGEWVASPYLANGEMPPGEYHITVNLSTGVPIGEISCKSHEINVVKEDDSRAQITLANPEDFAGNRDFILKYRLTGEDVQSGLVLTGSEEEKYFMLTVQPPERFTPEEIPPREYIFVLDVSGSMYGYPLETAKDLIRNLVSDLRENDKFNLILFADNTVRLSRESLAATEKNIRRAIDLIDEEEGGGGTSMMPALEEAIAIPMTEETARSVVIITDGYISNEDEIFDLINENMKDASFFPFGIGSSVNDYLIKGIAQCGLGESFVVTDSEDAADSAERFRTYIEAPLLTGVTVDYEGFDVYDAATSTPSILYAQKPIVLFGKWRGEPSGTITISGRAGNQDYNKEISVADVAVDTENEAIRYLWARTKLDQLAGFGSVRNDASVKDEITQLGLDYNLTTPYTSFVAVIDVVRNSEGNSKNVNQASPLPLGVSNLAVGGGYTAYSEPGDALLLAVAAGVIICGFLLAKRKSRNAQTVQ